MSLWKNKNYDSEEMILFEIIIFIFYWKLMNWFVVFVINQAHISIHKIIVPQNE